MMMMMMMCSKLKRSWLFKGIVTEFVWGTELNHKYPVRVGPYWN